MPEEENKKEASGVAAGQKTASLGQRTPSLAGLGQKGKKPEIVIYTMPKRFLGLTNDNKSRAHRIGMLIIAFGVIVLIVGFIFIYFYFTKFNKESLSSGVSIPKPIDISTTTPKKDNSLKKNEIVNKKSKYEAGNKLASEKKPKKEEKNREIKRVVVATSTISTNVATSTATTTVSTSEQSQATTSITPRVFAPAPDADNDSLTDAEEALLGTNPKLADTDGDGYQDGKELVNLYNPAGSGKIITNLRIKKYTNNIYNYSLYYPAQWSTETLGGLNSVMFKIDEGQFIQIIAEENPEKKNVFEWYKAETGLNFIKPEQKVYKAGWQGVRSQDGLTIYLQNPASDHIFVLTYNIGLETVLSYEHIFEMMVNSFSL